MSEDCSHKDVTEQNKVRKAQKWGITDPIHALQMADGQIIFHGPKKSQLNYTMGGTWNIITFKRSNQ